MSVLLVDDQHYFVVMMKGILTSLGFSKITVCSSPDEVIKLTSKNQFDIYLFDYNLGKGLNGRQLIEYLRTKKLAPYAALMLIITGDNSRSMVLSAVEQEPDDYIIKPFSQKQFFERLKKAITKKATFLPVYKALYKDDFKTGAKELEKVLSQNTPYDTYCRCLLASVYEKLEMVDLAEAQIREGLAASESDYLKFALGKILYRQGKYEDALNLMKEIIKAHPLMTDVLQYITLIYTKMGLKDKAAQEVKKAVTLSPLSEKLITLQIDTALANEDYLTARDSILMLLDVEKCYPEEVEKLLTCYAQCEFSFVEKSGDPYHISNTQKIIHNIISRYQGNINPERFSCPIFDDICEARVSAIKGDYLKGKRILYKTLSAFPENEKPHESILTNLYLGFSAVGEYEVAEQIQNRLQNLHPTDNRVSSQILNQCISSYVNNSERKDKMKKYHELNEQGIRAYKMGRLDDALMHFKEALRKVPSNTNALLNKIQVLLDLCEIKYSNEKDSRHRETSMCINECSDDLKSLQGLSLTPAQVERSSELTLCLEEFKDKHNL